MVSAPLIIWRPFPGVCVAKGLLIKSPAGCSPREPPAVSEQQREQLPCSLREASADPTEAMRQTAPRTFHSVESAVLRVAGQKNRQCYRAGEELISPIAAGSGVLVIPQEKEFSDTRMGG